MDKNLFLRFGIITFGLFLLLSLIVSTGILNGLDRATTVFLQSFIPRAFDTPFSTFSVLGTAEITGIVLLVLLLLRKAKIAEVLLLFIVVGLIEIVGKTFIYHPEPPREFLRTNIFLDMPAHAVARVAEFFSYPSGHSARTAFVSGFIIILILAMKNLDPLKKKIIITGVLVFDFLMLFSRVYLGEHWMTDVVGGALLGFSFAFFTSYFVTIKSSK
jgi:membrane-associated phospholipid phosphatase